MEVVSFDIEELKDDILYILRHRCCEQVAVFHHDIPKAKGFLITFIVKLTTCHNAFISFINDEAWILRRLLNCLLHVEDDEILSALTEIVFKLLDEIRV